MRLFFMVKRYTQKPNNTLLWIFILLALFVLFSFFLPFSSSIKNSVFNIISPIQRVMVNASSNLLPKINILQNKEAFESEVESLREENRRLLALLAKTKILEEENKALKNLLGFDTDAEKITIAEVLAREMGTHHITVRHKEEVSIDSAVTTPEGVLVGFVIESDRNISKVKLLTSTDSTLEAKVVSDNYPIGVIRGDGRRTLSIETLPKSKNIERGDLVVGQSYNGKTLNDIYIGRIVNTTDHDIEPFLSATVYQGVDIRYINYLFIANK